ncbi:MAG: hypothetical protein L0J84_03015 [Brachybacterium sp.]|uniref:hypothetical protein n=1 Tax=Brachybacterium sp. TaxID=1891286 RepID=UPI0026540010|nr:hypothetical protein [Brachybacterium sp.]
MSTAEPLRTLGLLAMRWSGLALALGVAAAQMWVEAAVAMLVALAQVVGWRWRLPIRWEAACSTACLIAAGSSFFLLYERIPWWDIPVHLTLNGLLAVLVAHVLRPPAPSAKAIVVTGAVLALVWELMERAGWSWVDASIHVAPADTVLDIAAGLGGAVAAALIWHRSRRRDRRSRQPEPTVEGG